MVDQDPEGPDKERNETEAEREDRKWDDMLQELRVIQTGRASCRERVLTDV